MGSVSKVGLEEKIMKEFYLNGLGIREIFLEPGSFKTSGVRARCAAFRFFVRARINQRLTLGTGLGFRVWP